MSQSTLAGILTALSNYSTEADAIQAWADGWKSYFSDATAMGVPVLPAALITAKTAMSVAMVGLSITGALSLQAGIIAFWGAITPAAFPPSITVTPPPALSSIAALLTPVFLSNTAGKLSRSDSSDAVAAVLHTANLWGTAIFPGVPPITVPII